jgi:hypothetical protein
MTREEKLAGAINAFLTVANRCTHREKGAGGMTIEAQMRRTVVTIPLMAIADLEEALHTPT